MMSTQQETEPNSVALPPWPPRALSARALGTDLDEDVWDRVISLWHHALSHGRQLTALRVLEDTAQDVRAAVLRGQAQLLLVMDGPRLLGFAAAGTASTGAAMRHVHVRPGVPEAEILGLLLGVALQLGSPASCLSPAGTGRDEA